MRSGSDSFTRRISIDAVADSGITVRASAPVRPRIRAVTPFIEIDPNNYAPRIQPLPVPGGSQQIHAFAKRIPSVSIFNCAVWGSAMTTMNVETIGGKPPMAGCDGEKGGLTSREPRSNTSLESCFVRESD